MTLRSRITETLHIVRLGLLSLAAMQMAASPGMAAAATASAQGSWPATASPIKHVIVIIGENRTFDHVFATYVPQQGESIYNLLSEGIIALDPNNNAIPGPNFQGAHQLAGTDMGGASSYMLSPPKQLFPNDQLPAPLAGGPTASAGYFAGSDPCHDGTTPIECAEETESGLAQGYYQYLLTGGTGLPYGVPDTRITNANQLPAGPFQLTNGSTMPYDSYANSPVHRFYQMWQQLDCSASNASNVSYLSASGCDHQLFAWVEVTVGAGANGQPQPANFSIEYSPNAVTTGEGSTSLAFYNVQQGDAPYLKSLADQYAMSDNYHQAVNGGTGANHIMLGHADMIYYTDAQGHAARPPENVTVFTAPYDGGPNPDAGVVHEIENPNPAPGTNNWYTEDGYGASGNAGYPPPYSKSPVYGGGSYSNCSDPQQPGVGPILEYLQSLPRPIDSRCEPGHYYLLNNYNPGFFGNSANAYIDQNPANTPFTIPPSSVPSIGDRLNEANISWKYYGDQWNNYINDPYQLNWGNNGPTADEYCNICNPFQYDSSIMTNPQQVATHLQDSVNLYADIAAGTLPAVSYVKPSGYVDGHPASSKLDLFEGFVQKIVTQVQNSQYANDTAIFITFDEGGGYYDSGYVQALDYFGDGTRIPLIVVSRYARPGHVSHIYSDHVSIAKFIERNWNLRPITERSRDNFPNPVASPQNPYVPLNSPAIGDLFDLFDFGQY